jgi:hypothetical protein
MPARAARDNGFAVPDPAAAKPELVALGTRARRAVTARSSKTSGLANESVAYARIYAQPCIIFRDSASALTSQQQLLHSLFN